MAVDRLRMMLGSGASHGDTVAARLASVAAHAPHLRATIILNLFGNLSALVLGVTLYGIRGRRITSSRRSR